MPSDCAISPSAVSNTVAGSNSLPSPVKSPFGSVVGRPVALPPSLEAIKSQMDALIQGYSSALSPIRERPLLVSSLEESSKAVKALAFIREHIYAIASALAVIVSTIGLILCPLLSPLFITSFVLAVTGTVLGVDLSLGGRYIFKNYGANKEAETRHTLLLHLRNLEAITPDQLWQLRRAKADKSAFIQGLAGVAGEMVNKGLMSESQKVECYKKLSIPLWSNCDQVLRYMAFLTAFHASGQKVREEYLSLHNYLDAHQETKKIVAETVKTMLPEGLFERWLEPLLNLQKIAAGSPMRPQLKEFKVRFLDWLYEQILGHGITSKEAHDYESRFDELLFEALGKASPEDLEEHSVRPLVTPLVAPSDERPLKKALVIISSGGGGHISIAEATRKALEADLQYRWEIKVINPLEESCSGIDPILIVSKVLGIRTEEGKHYNAEQFFSYLLKHDYRFAVNTLISFGRKYVARNAELIEKGMDEKIEKEQPDVIFSNVPFINGAASRAAAKRQIPFILTPGDMKSNYYGLNISSPEDSRFKCALAYPQWSLLDKSDWMEANLRPGQLSVVGFPLRPEFCKEKSTEEVRESLAEYELPADKKIITLMMGAQGSKAILDYLHRLVNPKCPAMHILVLCGKNEEIITKIQEVFKTHLKEHAITIQPIGFTQKVADILRRSDLYITKTGGNSVAEAWALSKNTLFDPPGIAGEVHNVEISEEMGFGKMIRPEDDLGAIVTEIFAKKDAELTLAQKRVRHYFQNFAKNILTEVHHVLS